MAEPGRKSMKSWPGNLAAFHNKKIKFDHWHPQNTDEGIHSMTSPTIDNDL